MMILGARVLRKLLGHKGEALLIRVSALIKWAPESSLILLQLCEDAASRQHMKPGKGSLSDLSMLAP